MSRRIHPPLACSAPGLSSFPSPVFCPPLVHVASGCFSLARSVPGFFPPLTCGLGPFSPVPSGPGSSAAPVGPAVGMHVDGCREGSVSSGRLNANSCARSGVSVAQSSVPVIHPSTMHAGCLTHLVPSGVGVDGLSKLPMPPHHPCVKSAACGRTARSGRADRDCGSCSAVGSERLVDSHIPSSSCFASGGRRPGHSSPDFVGSHSSATFAGNSSLLTHASACRQ